MIRTIKLRVRYYWRAFVKFTGFCPDCWTTLNYTSTGRPLCPNLTNHADL